MGMNSPTKGKKRILSDGTSADDILVSQTKSFAAKIVASAVQTNISKAGQRLQSNNQSQKRAQKSQLIDKHMKIEDGDGNCSPSKVIAFDIEDAEEK